MSKSRRLMVTGLLCVLPGLLPTHGAAQAYEALAMMRAAVTPPMPPSRLSSTGSLCDAVHARDGPRPADEGSFASRLIARIVIPAHRRGTRIRACC